MAARIVRRVFASPFVVTLAAAVPAAACYVQPAPARSGGPRTGEQVPNQQPPEHGTTNGGMEQVPAGNTAVIANPPRPMPVAKQTQRWTVTRANGTCSAFVNAACPEPPAGQPRPSCSPPPAMAYSCPPTMSGNMMTVVLHAGQSECQVEHAAMKCPEGAICNPPPPQKVACPQ